MDISIEAKSFGAHQQSDDAGVFDSRDTLVDTEAIEKARTRYEAIQAYNAGRATPEQTQLLRDLDDAINRRGRYAGEAAAPPQPISQTVVQPRPAAAQPVPANMPPGYRPPPVHSRNKR